MGRIRSAVWWPDPPRINEMDEMTDGLAGIAEDLDDEIEVSLPASANYVGTLRVLAAGLAARADLTIDEIEDIRLAVDEACALLLPHSRPGAPLVARFRIRPGDIRFSSTVHTDGTREPDRAGFSWSILEALSEGLAVDSSPDALSISFAKRREAAASA
jgi:serine/threonine-protein kinase RsbW